MTEAKKTRVDDGTGSPYDLWEIDGITLPSVFCDDPVRMLQDIKNLPSRDDDIVIAAYPKAGTHWVWEITNMVLRQTADYHPSVKEEQMMEANGIKDADSLTSPRVFNTHLRFRHLPRDFIERKCKVIYITRNPKDMAVSRYFHNKKGANAYKGTFSDYLKLYLDGKGKSAFGTWFNYTEDWLNTMDDNKDYPIHTVVYEELKRDPVSQVKKLSEFLGSKADDKLIEAICESCHFDNLKKGYQGRNQSKGDIGDPNVFAFRKGQIGDWKNWFTVAESELFDETMKREMPNHENNYIYE